jgi:hypothetical protein
MKFLIIIFGIIFSGSLDCCIESFERSLLYTGQYTLSNLFIFYNPHPLSHARTSVPDNVFLRFAVGPNTSSGAAGPLNRERF